MISAPSRLQLSSGSSLLVLLCLVLTVACVQQKGLTDTDEQETGKYKVYNPKTGEYELVDDAVALVDTVEWAPKENVPPPIGAAAVAPSGKKDVYEVALLMPFSAEGKRLGNTIDPKTRRFLNYYGGAKLALQDLESAGVNINTRVVDTRESVEVLNGKLDQLKDADVIIGPYDRACLQKVADFAAQNKIPVFSPWTPSIQPESNSEYFVQVVPGLQSHAEAMMRFASTKFDSVKFFLVANPSNKEQSRMKVYTDAYERYMPERESLEMLIVDDIALQPDSNDLTTVYHPELTNVFVMPYYLRSEQEFVNSFMRKIHAEHGEAEVAVLGLPQWKNFSAINADYLEGLQTHITSVQYIDPNDPEVQSFNRRYYQVYQGVPEPAARQAYDLFTFIGENLNEYGAGFLSNVTATPEDGYALIPVYDGPSGLAGDGQLRFIENKGIAILVFENQQFQRIE